MSKDKNKKDISVELLLLSMQKRKLIDRTQETVNFWRYVLGEVEDKEYLVKNFT